MNNLKWSFASIWNESLEAGRPERELKPRQNIWASEVGGAHIDRYFKMKGTKPTNPPNPRSQRKFEAGNLMEWVVELVLKRAGILLENQEWLSYQYPGLLEVTGKLDFFAGGKPDWEKAEAEVKTLGLPDFFDRATESIIKHFADKYPDGLEKVVIEVKSCSSFMIDRYEKIGADPKHSLQVFHYLKAKDMPEAHIVYICKDDLRMLEFGITNPSPIEDKYRADIEKMTNYIKTDTQPEKEPLIVFDTEEGKISQNWKVGYSQYLTKLYGFENQFSYEETFKKKTASWNRVLARCVNGDKMTKLNLEIIEEIKKQFPDFDEKVAQIKTKGIKVEDVKEE